jgi:amino acid adenylation domain-containing protein
MDLGDRISKLTPEQRRVLELKIKQQKFDIHQIPVSQEYRKNYEDFPISFEQEPMWFAEQFDPHNATYDILFAIGLQGNLNKEALEKSIAEIVKRHEILRTVFIEVKDKPVQVVRPSLTVPLEIIDYKGLPGDEQEQKLEQLKEDNRLHIFDLAEGPLLKAVLIEFGEDKYIFLTNTHHIISDIISTEIFFKELEWFYEAFSRGKPPDSGLPGLPFQYVDYACWQRKWFLESTIGIEARKQQETSWLEQFSGEVPVLNLPADYPRPAVKSREADQLSFEVGEEGLKNLQEVALKTNTTLYMVLLSCLYVLLARLSGQEDIVVGTPISSRKQKSLNNIMGLFTRTLALRNYPRGDRVFSDFLIEVNARTLEAVKNQEYQYDELVGKLLVERDLGRNPLFDVIFNLSYLETDEIKLYGLKMESLTWKNKRSAFDLDIQCEATYKLLFFKFAYSTKLFKEDTAGRFISYFEKITASVGKDPGVKICEIEILPGAEKTKILFDFNNTKTSIVRDKNYAGFFEDQVLGSPGKVAAVYGEQHITFGELNDEAGRIAAILSRQGAGAGTIISLYLKRNIKMLAAIIGIFKAGAAYLPLEIEYPGERIEFILGNSETRVVITGGDHVEVLNRMRSSLPRLQEIICPDHEKKVEGGAADSFVGGPRVETHPDDLAYLIYTSGTTGNPKGVMIHQLGMLNHLWAKINDLSITSADIIAQTASACFDISVWQFLAALLRGGTTVIIDKEILLDPLVFSRVLRQYRITILETVPSLMTASFEAGTQGRETYLRWVLSTGEPLTPALVNQWYNHYPHIPLVNAYGPTEAADDITHYVVPAVPADTKNQVTVPIGKPLQNFHIYILDKYLSLCPIGVRGEICVAGIGVGKGYWKNSEKTAAVFIPNPYNDGEDGDYPVLYKTGDLGYLRPDGNFECLGRLDFQVKIRGNRVELEEIENRLLSYEGIKEAVVTVRTAFKTGKPGENINNYLCAYIVSHHEMVVSELKEYLASQLPDYMVPSYIIPMETLPLTANGKIDRHALPEPVYNYGADKEYIAPTNRIEARLAEIWSELLAVKADVIGIDANFFELGGHSLKVPTMVSAVRKEFAVSIPPVEVFRTPTIRALSACLHRINPMTDKQK